MLFTNLPAPGRRKESKLPAPSHTLNWIFLLVRAWRAVHQDLPHHQFTFSTFQTSPQARRRVVETSLLAVFPTMGGHTQILDGTTTQGRRH